MSDLVDSFRRAIGIASRSEQAVAETANPAATEVEDLAAATIEDPAAINRGAFKALERKSFYRQSPAAGSCMDVAERGLHESFQVGDIEYTVGFSDVAGHWSFSVEAVDSESRTQIAHRVFNVDGGLKPRRDIWGCEDIKNACEVLHRLVVNRLSFGMSMELALEQALKFVVENGAWIVEYGARPRWQCYPVDKDLLARGPSFSEHLSRFRELSKAKAAA